MTRCKKSIGVKFASNTLAQGVILALYVFITLVYLVAYTFELSNIAYSIKENNALLESDSSIVGVERYTVADDGEVTVVLLSGRTVTTRYENIIFVSDVKSISGALYSEPNLICKLDSKFADSMVIGSTLYLVVVFLVVLSIVLFTSKNRDFTLLSRLWVRLLSCGLSLIALVLFLATYSIF